MSYNHECLNSGIVKNADFQTFSGPKCKIMLRMTIFEHLVESISNESGFIKSVKLINLN